MKVQSPHATEGCVMQASRPKDGREMLTGIRPAITVQMTVIKCLVDYGKR